MLSSIAIGILVGVVVLLVRRSFGPDEATRREIELRRRLRPRPSDE